MLKKTITYTDYNNTERTEDFYFNLSKSELIGMQLSTAGGFDSLLEKVIQTQDTAELMRIFKEIILKSYGEKSMDGKYFRKSAEISEAFSQTEAYNVLFMEMIQDADAASKFIIGIMPKIDGVPQIDSSMTTNDMIKMIEEAKVKNANTGNVPAIESK